MLDLLQKVFYTSDAARESFVELCEEEYVQKEGLCNILAIKSQDIQYIEGLDPVFIEGHLRLLPVQDCAGQ